MTDDSLQRVIDEMRSRAETADMVLGRVGQYELKAFSDRLTALSAQTEARDAARYRWLRDHCNYGVMGSDNPPFALNCDEPASEWDAAIDREIAQGDL